MKNKLYAIVAVMLLSACMGQHDGRKYVIKVGENETEYLKDVEVCPKIHIRRNDAKVIQKQEKQAAFEIEAVGYSGSCYFNKVTNQQRAIVKPTFKIVRLNNKNISDIHFSYYLETVKGPKEYLGKKTYFAQVSMPIGVKEVSYIADVSELSIPKVGSYDLDMYLGLNEDAAELQFKK